jgi:hypothetical protein
MVPRRRLYLRPAAEGKIDTGIHAGGQIVSGQDSDNKPPRSGRVRHDPGGRAVWEWAVESGRHALDSTSRLLKKLDLTSLRLIGDDEKVWEKKGIELPPDEDAPEAGKPPTFGGEREADPAASQRKSFNPYDTRTPSRSVPKAAKPAAPARPRITQPVRPAAKPGLLGRLFGRNK